MMTRKSRPKADDAFQMKFFQVTAKYWHKVEGFLNITILHTFRSKTIFFSGCKEFNIHIREHFQLGETLLFQYFSNAKDLQAIKHEGNIVY